MSIKDFTTPSKVHCKLYRDVYTIPGEWGIWENLTRPWLNSYDIIVHATMRENAQSRYNK